MSALPIENPAAWQVPSGVDQALHAAQHGFRVFPLVPGRKTPFERQQMNHALGLAPDALAGAHHATTDADKVRLMWSGDRADACIGIATGNGLIALDVDEKNGVSGSANINANGWTVPQTAMQRTPSGGWHCLFNCPPDTPAATDAELLGVGIDRRGDGGFVVLYDAAILSAPRADAPEWLMSPGRAKADRVKPDDAAKAPSYRIALEALTSREPDMDRNEWLAISGAFHTATAGLVDNEVARDDWLSWCEGYGGTNDRSANVRAWSNFRHGTSGDFHTLARMAAPGNVALAWSMFGSDPMPSSKPQNTRRTFDASNLFAHVLDGDDEPMRWHIEGLIPEDGFVPIYGVPKGGKTFIAMDMAASVATGTAFHEHDTAQGAVFYVCGEGFRSIKRRFAAWSEANGVSLYGAPLFRSQCAIDMLDAASAAKLSSAIAGLATERGAPRLIIVDTLARNFGPGDENSTSDMSRFISALDELKGQWDGCSVIVVHHSGVADQKRARGSGALLGAADAEYRVESNDTGPVLYNTAMKDASPARAMQFRLVDAGQSVALEYVGEPTGSPGAMSATTQMGKDTFDSVAVEGLVGADEWRTKFDEVHTSDKVDTRRRAFNRARDDLLKRQVIIEDGDNYRLSPMPGQMPER